MPEIKLLTHTPRSAIGKYNKGCEDSCIDTLLELTVRRQEYIDQIRRLPVMRMIDQSATPELHLFVNGHAAEEQDSDRYFSS